MYYKVQLKDHIRVAPRYFNLPVNDAVLKSIRNKYNGYIDQELGIVVDVLDIGEINDGIIIPGDGASYYETVFNIMAFKPELQEVIPGKIKDIADFGAFISLGPIEGMIHISQTMDDFVSFAESKVLSGKETKRMLKVGDRCRARVIAVSFKDITNPKLGLTMRQPGLGKLEWIYDEEAKKESKSSKPEKKEPKDSGAKKGAKK